MPTVEGKSDHPHVPWARDVLVAVACGCCGCSTSRCSYAWYFFVTWFPTYLNEVAQYDLKVQGALHGRPAALLRRLRLAVRRLHHAGRSRG